MATTAVYIDEKIENVYLLWHLLTNTAEDVVAYRFNLPRRKERSSLSPTLQENTITDSIIGLLQEIRPFEYIKISTINYDPQWTCISEFELIRLSKTNIQVNKIAFSDMVTMNLNSHSILRKCEQSVFVKESRPNLSIQYPLTELAKGIVDAIIELPSSIIDLVESKIIPVKKCKKAISGGASRSDLFAAENDILSGTHPRIAINDDGSWYVDGDQYFGIIERVGDFSFLKYHPFYSYLAK